MHLEHIVKLLERFPFFSQHLQVYKNLPKVMWCQWWLHWSQRRTCSQRCWLLPPWQYTVPPVSGSVLSMCSWSVTQIQWCSMCGSLQGQQKRLQVREKNFKYNYFLINCCFKAVMWQQDITWVSFHSRAVVQLINLNLVLFYSWLIVFERKGNMKAIRHILKNTTYIYSIFISNLRCI